MNNRAGADPIENGFGTLLHLFDEPVASQFAYNPQIILRTCVTELSMKTNPRASHLSGPICW